MSNPILEDYRQTLADLNRLLERKERQNADIKEITVLLAEIDEVAEVVSHLTKGESRFKWNLP